MALLNDSELKQQILSNLEEYSDSGEVPAYDTDFIIGFAEAQLPIYNADTIDQWIELPDNYKDSWAEQNFTPKSTIYNLMSIDLYNYYETRTSEILTEIQEERDNA